MQPQLSKKTRHKCLPCEFEKVDEVNTSEEFIRNHAEVNGKVIRVTLKPFETITLKTNLQNQKNVKTIIHIRQ